MKTLSRIILLLLLAVTTNLQAAKTFCGELDAWDQFGPFDYRTASKENLEIVESQHFTQNIRNLIRGEDAFLGDDITYTLVRFPEIKREGRGCSSAISGGSQVTAGKCQY